MELINNTIYAFHMSILPLCWSIDLHKHQLSLTDPHDALRHGERAANK